MGEPGLQGPGSSTIPGTIFGTIFGLQEGASNHQQQQHQQKGKARRLLIISTGAGNLTPEIESRLRMLFADHLIIPFDPKVDFEALITPRARVVVAGGDGTIEFVVRKLADSTHPLGILSLGTFNNFALALGLPADIEGQVRVIKTGRPRAITLGKVNGTVFLEACAIGLFGETIALGEAAKDWKYGALTAELGNVIAAKRFHYELDGDFKASGSAMSLVFTNTSSIGSRLPVGESDPTDHYLEFSVHAGSSRTDIVARALASAVLLKHKEEGEGQVFKFQKLKVTTRPKVRAYADNLLVGRTPATVTAEVSALKVILPRAKAVTAAA
jgi:diacylglycerol kinase (ATP)